MILQTCRYHAPLLEKKLLAVPLALAHIELEKGTEADAVLMDLNITSAIAIQKEREHVISSSSKPNQQHILVLFFFF